MSREILPRLALALCCAGALPGLACAQAGPPASGAAAEGIGLKLPPNWTAKPRQTASGTAPALQLTVPGKADKSLATALRKRGPRLGRKLDAGVASWYGPRFHGRLTANGETFNRYALTAAHKTLPLGTKVLVRNPRTGRQVMVRINDRGPYIRHRVLDLSEAAASALGFKARGHDWVVMYAILPPARAPDPVTHAAAAAFGEAARIATRADWLTFAAAADEAVALMARQPFAHLLAFVAP